MYNSYFGFVEEPFSVTPDPRFLYTNRVYAEAYANLQYGIDAKKGFIVITGEVGTGKTTLLRKLMRNLEGTIHSVFVFNTYVSFPELLKVIVHDLGLVLKERTKLAMLQELNDYLIAQLKLGHTVSVLIDEAQSLSDEVLDGLRLLSNLETDQEKLLQIVLMGQPELEAKLDQPRLRQLKQRVALQCRLAPLAQEEVGPYIDFRLRAVGYRGEGLFRPDAIREIAVYSTGIPRLINVICDNALLIAYAASQKIVSENVIKEVGRDLRLGSGVQLPDSAQSKELSKNEQPHIDEGQKSLVHHKLRPAVRTMAGCLVAAVLIIVFAANIGPQNFLNFTNRSLKGAQRNLGQWAVFIVRREVGPEQLKTEVASTAKPQRVVIIQSGSTVYHIASAAYGANALLGMDLIKEFNPQIKDLNRVLPGQNLILPSLTQQTLVRSQPDGSYRLIVASFPSLPRADEYAQLLRDQEYEVVVTPNRVSSDLVLHRIEIAGLKDVEEANRIWANALSNEWFASVAAGDPTIKEQVSSADTAY